MLEATGNLWTHPAHYRVVTTNGVRKADGSLVMGAGIALDAARRFPGLPAKLGSWVAKYGSRVFLCREEKLIAFPTKRNWRDGSDPSLVVASADQLAALADKFGIRSVVMPRPGCGCGGLDWERVRPTIEKILDDRFTVIWPGRRQGG